jgi:hypothetical protein
MYQTSSQIMALELHIQGIQKLLREYGDQIKVFIYHTPKDKRASRKSKRPATK